MVKKLLFALLFCSLLFCANNTFANTTPASSFITLPVDACSAPPPDSFRITGFGYDYVSLAWNPMSAGADHSLTVYQKNGTKWDSLYSVFLPNSTEYTVTILSPQKQYGFRIRTVCANGDPSANVSPFTGPTGVIVELTASGYAPTYPQIVGCKGINLPKEGSGNWVGFRVKEWADGAVVNATTFEFEAVNDPAEKELAGRVKRVVPFEGTVLVAANLYSDWPVGTKIIQSGLLFLVGKVNGPGDLKVFGSLEVEFNLEQKPPTLSICPSDSIPWEPGYTYEPLIGKIDVKKSNKVSATEELLLSERSSDVIKVQNPSSGQLNIFFPAQMFVPGNWHFQLESLNGAIILHKTIDVPEPSISIPYNLNASGLYVLSMKSPNGQVQRTKVIVVK